MCILWWGLSYADSPAAQYRPQLCLSHGSAAGVHHSLFPFAALCSSAEMLPAPVMGQTISSNNRAATLKFTHAHVASLPIPAGHPGSQDVHACR